MDLLLCARIPGGRGLDAETLSRFVKEAYATAEKTAINPSVDTTTQQKPTVRPRVSHTKAPSLEIQCFDNVTEAYNEAQRISTVNDKIAVFGSFMTVGPIQIGRASCRESG